MANEKRGIPQGGKSHQVDRDETLAESPAAKRQEERENRPGRRGSGEGASGLERGDGHPTGR